MTTKTVVEMFTKPCVICGEAGMLVVPLDGALAYNAGSFVQVAFPTLSAAKREQILSGTHPACWDEMFADPFDGYTE
jgi:hypothetical protein